MALLPWASTFSTDSLEREYQAELGPEKVRLTRVMAMLGALLVCAFAVLDLWAVPSALIQVWLIRGLIVTFLAFAFWSTGLTCFQARYSHIMVSASAIMGIGVTVMIYLAGPTEAASSSYYGGLLLIIMGIFTLTYVNLILCSGLALALVLGYVAVQVFAHHRYHGTELTELAAQVLVFASTTFIGIAAKIVRDSYSRENYLLRHSLQHDVRIKEEEKRHASYLAEHDPLTGLANRLRFDRDVNEMLERARRSGALVQILFLDLDGFKPVNDAHGHAVGDRVLGVVADRIRQACSPDDLVARVGGDEFVVALAAPADDLTAGTVTAEKISAVIAEGIELRGATLHLSASIGVAGYPMDGRDVADVMRAADTQMYEVKNGGKGGIAVTSGCRLPRMAG